MKNRRRLLIAVAGIALVVVVVLVASAFWGRKQTPFQNSAKLMSALQSFSRDQAAQGHQLPAEVSVADLLRGGYLTTDDVKAFAGMEVIFSTQAQDTRPQMLLARARTPDGQFICLLADGSVQQFSRSRYEEVLRGGPPEAATNGSQPVRSETNQPSATAGSGR